jgi:hypothetical protein
MDISVIFILSVIIIFLNGHFFAYKAIKKQPKNEPLLQFFLVLNQAQLPNKHIQFHSRSTEFLLVEVGLTLFYPNFSYEAYRHASKNAMKTNGPKNLVGCFCLKQNNQTATYLRLYKLGQGSNPSTP